MGFPGVFISSNITPAGIGDWTDGELFRLITTGVKRDGTPIFPVMPYMNYGKMDEEDIKSVIAYIRTLEPVQTNHPVSKADFPFSMTFGQFPKKLSPHPYHREQISWHMASTLSMQVHVMTVILLLKKENMSESFSPGAGVFNILTEVL